jgi:NTE family protein
MSCFLQALEDAGVTFKGIAGTSAGAVLGTAIAAGISTKDLKDELLNADFSSFVDGQPSETIWNFGNVLAMNEGIKIQDCVPPFL